MKVNQTQKSKALTLTKNSDTDQVLQYLEANCDTLVSSGVVPTLVLDNRAIFICGAAVSDSLEISSLLADVMADCG